MAATRSIKLYTGTNAGTESSGDADNFNLISTDTVDSDGTQYRTQSNRVSVKSSGTNYSYERWIRLYYSGTFTSINSIKVYLSNFDKIIDSGIDVLAGTTSAAATPINTVSSIATTTATSWDALAEAIDLTPSGGITSSPGYSNYLVIQLKILNTITTPADLTPFTSKLQLNFSDTEV